MYTRQQRLNNECTHREYYAQFVTDGIKSKILGRFNVKELKAAFKEDEHFNSIPLKIWDGLCYGIGARLRECGDYPTLAGQVCILKETAKQICEENEKS